MSQYSGGNPALSARAGVALFLCLSLCLFVPCLFADEVTNDSGNLSSDGDIANESLVILPIIDPPPISVGGGTAYYLVHSNVDGAEVYFDGDWYQGTIQNGTLLVRTCPTCTPVWTYTVKKCGYFTLTQQNHQYPGNNQTVDLYANLTSPKEPLILDISANVTAGWAPLAVGFETRGIGVSESWNWSFGDGTFSDERDPVHVYAEEGVYNVTLQASNSACQSDTVTKNHYITVKSGDPNFRADFTVSPDNGIAPLTVRFTDKSTGSPRQIAYDFGDGSTGVGANAAHTYRIPGLYTVTETITKMNPVTHTMMSSSITKPNLVMVFISHPITPYARFSASPTNGGVPLTVTFTDQSSGSPDRYYYDFGDGINSTDRNPVHTYRYPGIYTVTLTVLKYDAQYGEMFSDTSVQTGLIVAGNEV